MRLKEKFKDFLFYLVSKGYKPHTVGEYKRFLFGALSHCSISEKELKDLKLVDVAEIIKSGQNHGRYGAQRAVSVFRCYLKFLKESGEKLPFDWRDITLPKVSSRVQPVLTKEELDFVLNSIPIHHRNIGAKKIAWTMRALFEVLFATGMRISEALELKREQFKQIKREKELTIFGKGGEERRVFFSDRAIYWLEQYLLQRTDNSEWMFVNCWGQKLKLSTAKSYLLRWRKRLGYLGNKIRFHTFRRTLATLLMRGGGDLKTIQITLGHKSPRTTLRYYTLIGIDEAKENYQKLMKEINHLNKGCELAKIK